MPVKGRGGGYVHTACFVNPRTRAEAGSSPLAAAFTPPSPRVANVVLRLVRVQASVAERIPRGCRQPLTTKLHEGYC